MPTGESKPAHDAEKTPLMSGVFCFLEKIRAVLQLTSVSSSLALIRGSIPLFKYIMDVRIKSYHDER